MKQHVPREQEVQFPLKQICPPSADDPSTRACFNITSAMGNIHNLKTTKSQANSTCLLGHLAMTQILMAETCLNFKAVGFWDTQAHIFLGHTSQWIRFLNPNWKSVSGNGCFTPRPSWKNPKISGYCTCTTDTYMLMPKTERSPPYLFIHLMYVQYNTNSIHVSKIQNIDSKAFHE